MHECPECGSYCSCDGEDHHQMPPDDCRHVCPADDDDDAISSAEAADCSSPYHPGCRQCEVKD